MWQLWAVVVQVVVVMYLIMIVCLLHAASGAACIGMHYCAEEAGGKLGNCLFFLVGCLGNSRQHIILGREI